MSVNGILFFSNAVFHWINAHELLLQKIYKALKPNGKLICEFGAYGNISVIENGFKHALQKTGITYTSKFNFPIVSDFESLLTKTGFKTEQIYSYDRPTPLKDGERGLFNWAIQFFQSELVQMSAEQRDRVLTAMSNEIKNELWNGTCWIADYKRLRVIATK